MFLFILSLLLVFIAMLPCAMYLSNQRFFQLAESSPERIDEAKSIPVSVLIPARNEQFSIGSALVSILRTEHATIEILVMDDDSDDDTREVVRSYIARDARVQLLRSAPLPADWNGKQHACWQLASAAKYPLLLFLDADVRITPDAISRIVAERIRRNAPLISRFPLQETKTWFEKMMIPLMHYVLLGYLPIDRMRRSNDSGFAAGCGQMFMAERAAYFDTLGHFSIRQSRHDGIKLPRVFRQAGYVTDIFDATDISRCRMYHNARTVWSGLSKNATEGIGNARLILPFTVLLLGSSFFPWVVLLVCIWYSVHFTTLVLLVLAVVLGWIPRWMASIRFHQSWFGTLMHPLSVFVFIVIQWVAFVRDRLGMRTPWRGRL